MTTKEAVARFSDQNRPEVLRPFLARARAMGEMTVGFVWGMALLFFVSKVGPDLGLKGSVVLITLCFSAWFAGQAAGPRYFRIKNPKAAVRFYRFIGLHRFRRWMLDGDLMNARLRKTVPGYRVVSADPNDLIAYIERTKHIEKAHWRWFLMSVPFIIVAITCAHVRYAGWVSGLTLLTNVFPVFLQRFNRARCQVVLSSPRFSERINRRTGEC